MKTNNPMSSPEPKVRRWVATPPYKTDKPGVQGKWNWPLTCPTPDSPQFAHQVTERLPDDVPILTDRDICRDAYSRGRRKSLSEWLEATFSGCGGHVESVAAVILREICAEHSGVRSSFTEFEETAGTTDALVAQCWNEMLSRLGYDTTAPATAEEEYFGDAVAPPPSKPKRKKSKPEVPVEDRNDYFEE